MKTASPLNRLRLMFAILTAITAAPSVRTVQAEETQPLSISLEGYPCPHCQRP